MTPDARGFPGDEDYVEGDNYDELDGLLGTSVPSVRFPEVGTTVEGTILDMTTATQRNPQGVVQTWDDGSPRKQAILTLQTDEHVDEEDDGRRRLFVKGATMPKAFREAVRAARVPGPRPGGRVRVTYASDGEARSGLNPPKVFEVSYTPPSSQDA